VAVCNLALPYRVRYGGPTGDDRLRRICRNRHPNDPFILPSGLEVMSATRVFTSDNCTPVSEPILAAINAANGGMAPSYGLDDQTAQLERLACELFETELKIFPVVTGTAANALALSQIASPYGAIYCHDAAHIMVDEAGAPEFFAGGAKLIGFPSLDGKITPRQITEAVDYAREMGVHHVPPSAVSLSQTTEWGAVYSLREVAALCDSAHQHHLPVHMDGARFANALAHLGCSPADATWRQGVDVMSLGATKNGALCAEAVIFFNTALTRDFEQRRKRAGHLWSKSRFLSVQLLAYFAGGLWLTHARHANAMAASLARGLAAIRGVSFLRPLEANELFVILPEPWVKTLEVEGFHFYRWGRPRSDGVLIRLVTSFATRTEDVEDLLTAVERTAA
jgi:threonine aldolase